MKTKRKLIDIEPNTFHALSLMAAHEGLNLKKFIEQTLNKVAEEYDANAEYAWMIKNYPEASEMVSEAEQDKFEKEIGL